MSELSRTVHSLRNARTSLSFGGVVLILGFFSRKIFIDSLGVEVLGLNTTIVNLLGFLNLAELGISGAISFTLYAPLYQKEFQTVNEIVSVQGWLYRRVAYIVLAGGVILMFFFPWIFAKIDLPLWYAYGSFGVMLIGAMLCYIINYQQIVFTASQQEYKVTTNLQGFRILKILIQIIGIGAFGLGYVYWLAVELIGSLLSCIFLHKSIRKSFPWLRAELSRGKQLALKYPDILRKTKQQVFHKFAGFALTQTGPLIIYALLSLTVVAIYGNYVLLIVTLSTLINSAFNGTTAGIGHLVAEGKREKIVSFFKEYTVGRYWLTSIICFGLYQLTPQFITLWLGKEYLLDSTSFILIVIYAFISLTRINESFLMAYGLCHDIYSPLLEGALNLGLSILLGYYCGLPGILSGILISLFVVVCCWRPYFLCTRGLKLSFVTYCLLLGKILAMTIVSWVVGHYFLSSEDFINHWPQFILTSLKTLLLYTSISFCVFWIFSREFRLVNNRIYPIICSKK